MDQSSAHSLRLQLRAAVKASLDDVQPAAKPRTPPVKRTCVEMTAALSLLLGNDKKRKKMPCPDSVVWRRDGPIVGCEGLRRFGSRTEACWIEAWCDDPQGRLFLSVDSNDGFRTTMDSADAHQALDRFLDKFDPARRIEAAKRRADRFAAEQAAAAAHAALEKGDWIDWDFACVCGIAGHNFDDGTDMIQCANCFGWAHTKCARGRLKGHPDAAKASALRPHAYVCAICAPRRYLLVQADSSSDAEAPHCYNDEEVAGLTLVPSSRPGIQVWLRRDPTFRDRTVLREVCDQGTYERPCFRLDDTINAEVVPGDTWLDVGAHVGTFAALCLSVGAAVVAVEPDADNWDVLVRNGATVAAASPGSRFVPVRAAVADHAGTTRLFLHPGNIAFRHSTHPSRETKMWRHVAVDAVPLPVLLEKYGPFDGVKLDIQGAEIAAVDSVRDWGTVSKLCLEYDFEYAPNLPEFHAFVARLRSHFPLIHHPKQRPVGEFVGFPTATRILALRKPSP